ncbi:MAG: hypothetical protein KBH81_09160 [Phycisphaerae bacterium]|jgi:ribosomal protein S27E|nr:hypothetical protein [Phycisphaerae bacterium]HOO16994.1 hypothetical protein [Phycisphaerae bacterium]HPC21579.1 hypothetical protein [Phycisphaerae bacterium]HRS27941.1 hypothetical protein [Phycisphaerae bacterium]HRT42046.1 hypothetical protein [Phycisphaerae bacterium]
MNAWLRRAEMNKNLIIVLVLLAVVSGGFWTWKCRSTSAEVKQVVHRFKDYYVTCKNCGTLAEKVPASEVDAMKSDMQGGYLKCPSCGNYTAKFGKNPFKGSEAQGEQEQADDDEP